MITKKHIALATLVACALAFPAFGSTKNPVERPFRGEATVTWVVNMLNGSATGQETGVGTHLGLYTNESSAIWDLNNFVIVSGTGVVTTADGEQAFWRMTPDQPGIVQVTGGTGRLENVTGSLEAVPPLEPIITVDWTTMTMTMTITYTAVGTLTY
jgi:hypothetical protein